VHSRQLLAFSLHVVLLPPSQDKVQLSVCFCVAGLIRNVWMGACEILKCGF